MGKTNYSPRKKNYLQLEGGIFELLINSCRSLDIQANIKHCEVALSRQ